MLHNETFQPASKINYESKKNCSTRQLQAR